MSQLYVALLGRAPDAEGLDFWAGRLAAGQSMAQVADAMYATEPARAYLPGGMSNQDMIASFYVLALGREADAEGLAFWTARLDSTGATPGSVLAEMVQVAANYDGTDEAGSTSAALFNNRTAAAHFYAEHGGSVANAMYVVQGVSEDPATVVAARSLYLGAGSQGTYNAGGFAQVRIADVSGYLRLTDVAPGTDLVFVQGYATGNGSLDCTYALADATGAQDAVNVVMMSDWGTRVELGVPGIESINFSNINTDAVSHRYEVDAAGQSLRSISVAGSAVFDIASSIMNQQLTSFDASTSTGGVTYFQHADTLTGTHVTGSWGSDYLFGGDRDDVIVGGENHDTLYCGAGMDVMTGGGGFDTFSPAMNADAGTYATITDFTLEEDAIELAACVSWGFASFNPAAPVFDVTASLRYCLDRAARMDVSKNAGRSHVEWFQHGGDTWLVVDNSTRTTFDEGVDQVVRLTGLIDLSGLTLVENVLS